MNPEIEPSTLKVFGVTIVSRYGVLSEVVEMIEFLQDAQKAGLVEPIDSLFYDSNIPSCTFTFKAKHQGIEKQYDHPILKTALKYIAQFEWNGEMKHSLRSEMLESGNQP